MDPDIDWSDWLINGGLMTLKQTDGLLFTGCLTAACFCNNGKELSRARSFSYRLRRSCAPMTELSHCRGDTVWGRKWKVLLSGL